MGSEADEICLQRAVVNSLTQRRDAMNHRLAIERAKLARLIEQKRNEIRDDLLCEK